MVVMILERVRTSLRGELTRWMLEPKAGVFVGRISSRVRDRLWDMVKEKRYHNSAGILLHGSNTEQGFRVKTFGHGSREAVDYEGLVLMRRPSREPDAIEDVP